MRAGTLGLLLLTNTIAVGVILWLGMAVFRQPRVQAPTIAGLFLDEPRALEDFTLRDHTGRFFHRDRFQGQWTLVYFGYTSCPDACPLTLLTLDKVQKHLAQKNMDNDTAYLFISLDPERDTLGRLGAYTTYFNQKFVGATGTPEELFRLAQQCLMSYKRAPTQEGEEYYTIDHSSAIVVIDPQAHLRALIRAPYTPEGIATDYLGIRAFARAHTPG
jgi:protein SCO1/2